MKIWSLMTLWNYFPKYKSFILGITLSGAQFGEILFNIISKNNSDENLPIKYYFDIGKDYKQILEKKLIFYYILSVIIVALIFPYKYKMEYYLFNKNENLITKRNEPKYNQQQQSIKYSFSFMQAINLTLIYILTSSK